MTLQNFLTKLVRSTRGRSPRPVEFEGLPVEVPKVGENGEIEKAENGEIVYIANSPDNLPDSGTIYSGIVELLSNSENDIRVVLAKTYNAIKFSAAVAATAAAPAEDFLTPVFAEFGITDADLITKLRRALTAAYNGKVEIGKYPAGESAEDMAAHKVALLRKMLAD